MSTDREDWEPFSGTVLSQDDKAVLVQSDDATKTMFALDPKDCRIVHGIPMIRTGSKPLSIAASRT